MIYIAKIIKYKDFEIIYWKIQLIRGQKVILDFGAVYQIENKFFNQSERRYTNWIPIDFKFKLTTDEYNFLRSQFASLEKNKNINCKLLELEVTNCDLKKWYHNLWPHQVFYGNRNYKRENSCDSRSESNVGLWFGRNVSNWK